MLYISHSVILYVTRQTHRAGSQISNIHQKGDEKTRRKYLAGRAGICLMSSIRVTYGEMYASCIVRVLVVYIVYIISIVYIVYSVYLQYISCFPSTYRENL